MHKIVFLSLLLLVSCSSPEVEKKAPMTLREKLIEKYRLMRLNSFKGEGQTATVVIKRAPIKKVMVIKPPKRINPVKRVKRKRVIDYIEKQKEIEQNISYYCIKNEGKYDHDEDCLKFAHTKLVDCQVSLIRKGSTNVVRCLKRKLRLR